MEYGVSTSEMEVKTIIAGSHYMVTTGVIKAGSGELSPGTLLGIETSSGKWKPYNREANDGSEVQRGVLLESVNASDADARASILVHGEVRKTALVGYSDEDFTKLLTQGILVK